MTDGAFFQGQFLGRVRRQGHDPPPHTVLHLEFVMGLGIEDTAVTQVEIIGGPEYLQGKLMLIEHPSGQPAAKLLEALFPGLAVCFTELGHLFLAGQGPAGQVIVLLLFQDRPGRGHPGGFQGAGAGIMVPERIPIRVRAGLDDLFHPLPHRPGQLAPFFVDMLAALIAHGPDVGGKTAAAPGQDGDKGMGDQRGPGGLGGKLRDFLLHILVCPGIAAQVRIDDHIRPIEVDHRFHGGKGKLGQQHGTDPQVLTLAGLGKKILHRPQGKAE